MYLEIEIICYIVIIDTEVKVYVCNVKNRHLRHIDRKTKNYFFFY